ncbi:methyltransferase, FxLD system [Phytohabitans rumicis]|nr:methyltransferase, FxLD system [Phytohabitans rumicis]
MTENAAIDTCDVLRFGLADLLRTEGVVSSHLIDSAVRTVPRHVFVPTVPLRQAYADDVVHTKRDSAGVAISAASQPRIVAMMLEQLGVEPGQRVLEIGAGTGYNAALLAHLVGDHGQVTTIDVDDDIVTGARAALDTAGCANVRVVLGDGAFGGPDDAPYDRVIATVGAWDVPPAWLEQLAPNGRLVVPMRVRGSITRSITFERAGDCWRSRDSEMCGFMPLRGIAADPRRTIALTPDGEVTLEVHPEQTIDQDALAGVLDRPRDEQWTGVCLGPQESAEWVWLWLACTLPNTLSRMPLQPSAIDRGLVRSMFGWGTMATTDHGALAYLTLRDTNPDRDAGVGRVCEIGAIGQGPGGADLARRLVDEIRRWDREYRTRTPHFAIQPAGTGDPITGQFVFDLPLNRLAVDWVHGTNRR